MPSTHWSWNVFKFPLPRNRKGNHQPIVDNHQRGHLYSQRYIHPWNSSWMGIDRHLDWTLLGKNLGKYPKLHICKIHYKEHTETIWNMIKGMPNWKTITKVSTTSKIRITLDHH